MEEQAAETTTEATSETAASETTTETAETGTTESTEQATEEQAAEIEYTDFDVPEGTAIDPALLGEFKSLAKEAGLSQENAQKLVDWELGKVGQSKAVWLEQAKADPLIGGVKFNANVAVAQRAINTFGDPELKAVLDASGLGNHPAIIRAFFKAGNAVSEETKFIGTQAGDGVMGAEERINNFYKKSS